MAPNVCELHTHARARAGGRQSVSAHRHATGKAGWPGLQRVASCRRCRGGVEGLHDGAHDAHARVRCAGHVRLRSAAVSRPETARGGARRGAAGRSGAGRGGAEHGGAGRGGPHRGGGLRLRDGRANDADGERGGGDVEIVRVSRDGLHLRNQPPSARAPGVRADASAPHGLRTRAMRAGAESGEATLCFDTLATASMQLRRQLRACARTRGGGAGRHATPWHGCAPGRGRPPFGCAATAGPAA
jgi:hypothetical protein